MIRTPYLVLFVILGAVGVGTASALITITLAGDVVIEGDLDMTNGKISNLVTPSTPADAATKAYVDSAPGTDTLALLGCTTEQVARWDGSVWVCGKFVLKNNPIVTVDDSVQDTGKHTSIAIGQDGNPVISYYHDSTGDLRVAHCGNAACSEGNTITTIDSADDVGVTTSIAIGTDGNPVISYYDNSNDSLKVAHCGNAACSEGNTITTIDSEGVVGFYSSIAIGTDNKPVISYYDGDNGSLKVAHCGNLSCSSENTLTTIDDNSDDTGLFTSIVIGTDNNPVISYYDDFENDLKVAHCGNPACSSENTITTVDPANAGRYTSIAIGPEGNPAISYQGSSSNILKFVYCENTTCSTNSVSVIDSESNLGLYTSIAIGTDGHPVISYYDIDENDLKVAFCTDVRCTTAKVKLTRVDTVGSVGSHTSIAIGTNGSPVISYYDTTNDNLKVVVDGSVLIFK